MKSRPIGAGQNILATQNNDRRDDARGGGFLLAHQQLGTLALGTEPTNGQVIPIVINGTTITVTAVTAIGSAANNVLIGGSALTFVTNLVNFLRRPDLTTSTQVAASSANQTLLSYVGWAWPGSSTNIVPFSLNKNVNGISGGLSSFNITGITVTSGTWTAQTLQLYVEDGVYYIGATRVVFAGGSTPTVTAPVSHPRIDVLSINGSGTLSWTTGTESSSPVAPGYPAGQIVICELYNIVSETALYDNENQQSGEGYIYNDVRPMLGGTYISSTTQVASGLFIVDPGSEVQGNTLYYNGAAWVLLAPGTSGEFLQTQGGSANPQWAPVNIGETDGTQASQNLTATTSLQTTNLTVTHGLGRTPVLVNLSCALDVVNNPGSGQLNAQMFMSYDASGNAVSGIATTYIQNNGAISSLSGAANPFTVVTLGGTQGITVSVGVTSIGATTFTIQIKWQITTGSGSLTGSSVSGITWAVIG